MRCETAAQARHVLLWERYRRQRMVPAMTFSEWVRRNWRAYRVQLSWFERMRLDRIRLLSWDISVTGRNGERGDTEG